MVATKAIQYKIPKESPPPDPFRLTRIDGGINWKEEQSSIRDNQSPYMPNMCCDDRGALQKRPGQELLFATSLGAGDTYLFVDYRKKTGTVKTLLHHGTKLYTQSGTDQPVEISSGLSNQKGAAFVFGDIFYYVLPSGILTYDGTTVAALVPYVPTVTLGRPAAGGGTTNEQYNLLSNSFKDSFSADGTVTVYQLSQAGLSATTVLAWVSGVAKVENTDFTVNRTTGQVTWGTAPIAGTNNVVIQAEKTGLMDATRINKCIYHAEYGGANDTRVHLTGNPDYPSAVFRCDVMRPTYWPENAFNFVGNDSDKNTGLLVHYDSLLLFKERSIQRSDFTLDNGVVVFNWRPINSFVGCDIPNSIQLINNSPTFANTYKGVCILVRTDERTEKNVETVSGNINGAPTRSGLLDETKANLLLATSVDFDGKYWLNVGTKAYVWDYQLSPYNGNEESLAWFLYDSINANCWLIRDRELYYGKRGAGQVVRFIPQLADFDTAIKGVWKSKLFHFGYPEWLKTISEVYFRSRETANTSLTIDYFSDTGETLDSITLTSSSFSLVNFTLALFSLAVYHFPPVFRLRPKMKKVVYFQFQISNNVVSQNLSIMDLVINFTNTKRVK